MRNIVFLLLLIGTTAFGQKKHDIETIIQRGHHGPVTAIKYSKNGEFIVSGSRDKTIRIWETATGRELRVLNGHEYTIRSIVFSPDERKILCGSNDGSISICNVSDGALLSKNDHPKDRVTSVAWSLDGKWIACGGYDWKVYVWKADSLQNNPIALKVSPAKGTGEGIDLKFSKDSKHLAIGQDNYQTDVYETNTWTQVSKLRIEDGGYCGGCASWVAFSDDGKYVRTASSKKGIYQWALNGSQSSAMLTKKDRIGFFKVNEAADIYVRGYEEKVHVHRLSNHSVIRTIDLDSVNVWSMDINTKGDQLALGCDDRTIKLIDLKNGLVERVCKGLVHDEASHGLDYDQNSMWDHWILHYIKMKSAISMSPDGNFLLMGKIGTVARMIELRTGRVVKEFKGHDKVVLSTRFSANGKEVLTGGADGRVLLWDVATGKLIREFKGHTEPIFDLQFDEKAERILTASWDGYTRLWDVKTGEQINQYEFRGKAPFAVKFVMNGLYFLAANLDGKTRLVEIDTGEEVNSLIGHTDKVQSLEYGAKSNEVVTASWDGLVKVWDVSTGYQLKRYAAQDGKAHAATYSHNGAMLATGDTKGRVVIYGTSGEVLYVLSGHKSAVNTLLFTNDDQYLISGSIDGELKVWEMNNRRELYAYHSIGEKDWLVATPEGLFDATSNARNYIFFVNGLKSYSIDQFFEEFYQPSLIRHLYSGLDLNSGDKSIRHRVAEFPPPEITIEFPKPGTQLQLGTNEMMVTFKDAGGGIDELKIMHNGKRIPNDRKGLGRSPKKGNVTRKIFQLDIVPGLNTITVTAFSKGRVESRPVVMNFTVPTSKKKVTCHVLAVGINKYTNSKLNLNYAKDDAEVFVKTLSSETKNLYDKVVVHQLYNDHATKKQLLHQLDQIALQANTEDVFMFYYAGHGSMIAGEFYFITSEITRLYDESVLSKEALSASEVQEVFKHIKALKQVVILDACHSGGSTKLLATRGGAEEKAIAQLSRSSGVHVFASAGSEQYATEFKKLGHGVFTYLLVKALKGEADGAPADGRVTVFELKSYLDSKVPELSEEMKGTAQYPYTFSIGNDFPVSFVK